MKYFASLTGTSMYKALTDQHEAVTLSNEQNILSNDKHEAVTVSNEQKIFINDISDCESDESNVYKYNNYILMILIIIEF